MRKVVSWIIPPLLIICGIVLFVLVSRREEPPRIPRTQPGAGGVGLIAPPFQARTLSGRTVDLPADYRGKLVLLTFWATWCPPCRAEIPYLVEAYQRFSGQGLEILGISLDDAHRGAARDVLRFAAQQQMPWEQILDGNDVARIAIAYGVDGIPATFLIDGDTGQVLAGGELLRGANLLRTISGHLNARTEKPQATP